MYSQSAHLVVIPARPADVMIRLLECPRLTPAHTQMMLRNRNLPTRVLSAIYRSMSGRPNEEARWLFVTHPNAMLSEVTTELGKLDRIRLRRRAPSAPQAAASPE